MTSPPNNARDQQTTMTFRLYNRFYKKEIELNYWKIRDFKELKMNKSVAYVNSVDITKGHVYKYNYIFSTYI